MLLAIDEQNKKILAEHATKEQNYRCPSCKNPLILKQGKIVTTHFAHYPAKKCFSFSEGESMDHIEGKKLLFRWLSSHYSTVELEAFLPQIQQRPDLYFENERKDKVCVEFQCSKLSSDEMLKRTLTYQHHNYSVWWILGPNSALKQDKISALQKLFVFPSHLGLSIARLNIFKEHLELINDFGYSSKEKLNWTETNFSLENSSPDLIFTQNPEAGQLKKFKRTDYLYTHHKYMKQIKYKNKNLLSLVEKLYRNRESLHTVSYLIYQSINYEWMIRNHPMEWKYDVLQIINKLPEAHIFSRKEFLTYIKELKLKYYDMPLVQDNMRTTALFLFLDFLCLEGILTEINSNTWRKNKSVISYSNEGEKIKHLYLLSQQLC